MDSREPNSRGYWRRNDIAGLRLMQAASAQARDPEDLERIRADAEALVRLRQQERAVRERHQRLEHLRRGSSRTLES
jgi:hypothetical protein